MKILRAVGATSQILQVFIRDSSSTTGAGLTGLTNASSGLVAYYHRDTDTTATAISLVTMTVGTFTSSGFKEIDSTNMPGWYQFCPPNASMAAGAVSVAYHLKGATNMASTPIEVDLAGNVTANTTQLAGQTVTAAAGVTFPSSVASPTNITAGTLTTVTNLTNLPSIPNNWITAAGIAAAALNGKGDWNTTTPPTTAAIAAAILATPANLLVTDISGRILLQPTQTGVTIPTVTTVGTTTNLTNLPSIPANWITAAGIATDAIGSSQLAASAVTEIQTGLATSATQTSQGVQISWLQNFLGGDKSIDTATTPWNEVVKIAGTGTELIRKKLRDTSGANITSTTVVIGSAKDA